MAFLSERKIVLDSGGAVIAPSARAAVIAGNCGYEGDDILLPTLEALLRASDDFQTTFILKTSFFKANRSTLGAFESLCGSDKFAALLLFLSTTQKLKQEHKSLHITTDIHSVEDILPEYLTIQLGHFQADPKRMDTIPKEYQARVRSFLAHTPVSQWWDSIEILQIPAFLSPQNDLLRAAASTGKIISVKKNQMAGIEQYGENLKLLRQEGNSNIIAIDRGTLKNGKLIIEPGNISYLQDKLRVCAFVDITHGAKGHHTTRNAMGEYEDPSLRLLQQALTEKPAGIFFETHPRPSAALSDGVAQIPLQLIPFYFAQIAEGDVQHKRFSVTPSKARLYTDYVQQKTSVLTPPDHFRVPQITDEASIHAFLQGAGDTTINLFYPPLLHAVQTGQTANVHFSDIPRRGGYLTETFGDLRLNTFIKNTSRESLALLRERKGLGEINIAFFSNIDFMNSNLPDENQEISRTFLREADIIACRTEGQKELIQAWLERDGIDKDIVVFKDTPRGTMRRPLQKLAHLANFGTADRPLKLRASCYSVHLESYLKALRTFRNENRDLYVSFELMTSGIRPDQAPNVANAKVVEDIRALADERLEISIVPYTQEAQERLLQDADAFFIDPDTSDNPVLSIWMNREVKGINRARGALWGGVPVVAIGPRGLEGLRACYTADTLSEALKKLRDDPDIISKILEDQRYLVAHYSMQEVYADRQRQISATRSVQNYVHQAVTADNSRLRLMAEAAAAWTEAMQEETGSARAETQFRRDIHRFMSGLDSLSHAVSGDNSKLVENGNNFLKTLNELADSDRKLILTGAGKSANIAAVFAFMFRETGLRTRMLTVEDLNCGDFSQIEPGDVALVISKSGNGPLPLLSELGAQPFLLTHTSDNKNVGFPQLLLPMAAEIGLPKHEEDIILHDGIVPSVSSMMDYVALEALSLAHYHRSTDFAGELKKQAQKTRKEVEDLLSPENSMPRRFADFAQDLKKMPKDQRFSYRSSAFNPFTVLTQQILFTYTNLRHDPDNGLDIEPLLIARDLRPLSELALFALVTSLAGQEGLGKDLKTIQKIHPAGALNVNAGRALATLEAIQQTSSHPLIHSAQKLLGPHAIITDCPSTPCRDLSRR